MKKKSAILKENMSPDKGQIPPKKSEQKAKEKTPVQPNQGGRAHNPYGWPPPLHQQLPPRIGPRPDGRPD